MKLHYTIFDKNNLYILFWPNIFYWELNRKRHKKCTIINLGPVMIEFIDDKNEVT